MALFLASRYSLVIVRCLTQLNTVEYVDGKLRLIDQTLLPLEQRWVECTTYDEVAEAIRTMKVRGAPAIGVTAAYGMALGAIAYTGFDREGFEAHMRRVADR